MAESQSLRSEAPGAVPISLMPTPKLPGPGAAAAGLTERARERRRRAPEVFTRRTRRAESRIPDSDGSFGTRGGSRATLSHESRRRRALD